MKSLLLLPVLVLATATAGQAATFAGTAETKIVAPDGAAQDVFGSFVALSDDLALVGSPHDDDNGSFSGSAYVFDGVTGAPLRKLTAYDGAEGDSFGFAVDLYGTTALIGARFDDDNGTKSGSAYLFDATNGDQLMKLTPSDGEPNGSFGHSVALYGSLALVGAGSTINGLPYGVVYVFDTNTGAQLHKLTADDAGLGDQFGLSVDLYETTAIIGSLQDDDTFANSGSAYIFDAFTGTQLAKLTAPDAAESDHFGIDVAIDGTTALVGSEFDDDMGLQSGSAYVFDVTTGAMTAKLTAQDGEAVDRFGAFVEISGTTALVSNPWDDDNGAQSGSAYVFDTTTGSQIGKLTASDGAAGDVFGAAVALSGTRALIGSVGNDEKGADAGAAYLYTATGVAPVPLPAGVWLLGAALGLLVLRGQKKRVSVAA